MISHRHPDICADETRGRAIPPARAGADPRPGKNGVAPANRTGPVKPDRLIDAAICRTRCAVRVREFRVQGSRFPGTGFQGTGTSGGSRPISGMGAGPEHVPSRAGFFAAGHAGIPAVFFNRRYRANSGATPSAVFPRVSGGHFVSDPGPFRFRFQSGKN